MTPVPTDFTKALRYLARRDPVLRQLIRQVGPCAMQYNPDRFAVLVHSILSQQISTRAAASIRARLLAALHPVGLTPARILKTPADALRAAGLSANKTLALHDLAHKVHHGVVPLDTLHELTDDEVVEQLIPVRGIGRWTAQMFLMFSLGRLDVLPVADWGLRVGVQRQYGLTEPPRPAPLEEIAEPWRPYRSVATWYIWRSLAVVPQSAADPAASKGRKAKGKAKEK